MTRRWIRRFLCLALATATPALAQTGSIGGRITDSTTSAPVAGADVRATSGTSTAGTTIAGSDGGYRITNVPPGTYDIVVKYIGYAQRRIPGVRVAAGQNVQLDIRIAGTVTALNPTVISASRQSEKELDAPAHVGVVEGQEIRERSALTVTDNIRGVPGVDATTGGIAQTNIVTRGFNNAFSGALLTLQDYRFAGVPSLRVNVPLLFTGTSDDIDRIEVLLGTASALYGPNSSSGVLHIITKSPFDSRGTILTLDGGERSILHGAGRYAGTMG